MLCHFLPMNTSIEYEKFIYFLTEEVSKNYFIIINSMQMGFTCCCILKFQGIFIRKFVLGIIHIQVYWFLPFFFVGGLYQLWTTCNRSTNALCWCNSCILPHTLRLKFVTGQQGFPLDLENLGKWQYTWKTWKYHGILKNLINMEKWHETWKNLVATKKKDFWEFIIMSKFNCFEMLSTQRAQKSVRKIGSYLVMDGGLQMVT